MAPLVSIVTINYNQYQFTCDFLRSIGILKHSNLEVIVIDNHSADNKSEQIKSEFPWARVYRTKENLGFTGGNNVGIKLAKGDFVLIVNNDTEMVDPDFIGKLLSPFSKDPKIGMVSPKILFFENPNLIQYAGFEKVSKYTGKNGQVGFRQIDDGKFDSSGFTHYAHGAAMMVSRELINTVGVFPEHFFLCYEELDWSAQASKSGFKIFYQAQTRILHKESASMGRDSPLKVYYNNRNRILFMRRNSSPSAWMVFFVYFSIVTIPKNILAFLLKAQFDHLKSFLAAIGWNIQNARLYSKAPFLTRLSEVSLGPVQVVGSET